jgi:hypothetical protein
MVKDPLLRWDGPFPYDALAPVGVTPVTSQAEVRNASFELLAQGLMSPETNRAWEELRLVQRRVFVDFLLYDVDLDAEVAAAQLAPAAQPEAYAEPLEVAEALAIPPDLADGLADELRPVDLPPLPRREPMPEFEELISMQFVDALIRFDR